MSHVGHSRVVWMDAAALSWPKSARKSLRDSPYVTLFSRFRMLSISAFFGITYGEGSRVLHVQPRSALLLSSLLQRRVTHTFILGFRSLLLRCLRTPFTLCAVTRYPST